MDSSPKAAGSAVSDLPPHPERRSKAAALLATLTLVQFYHFMDFVAAIPLGPDFARDLRFDPRLLGWIGGVYTLAAACSGFVFSYLAPMASRKRILVCALLSLGATTLLFARAESLESLLLARALSGLAAGPAVAAVLAVITESFSARERGFALGTVMISFSLATVLGIPAALEFSLHYGWRPVFLLLGALGFGIAILAAFALPSEGKQQVLPSIRAPLSRREKSSLTLSAAAMASTFLIVPQLAHFVQSEGNVSRASFGTLQLVTGAVSLVALPLLGKWTDRIGAWKPMLVLSVLFTLSVLFGLAITPSWIPGWAFFIVFTLSQTGRALVANTLSTELTSEGNAFRFQSLQTSAQNLACAVAAILSTGLLMNEDSRLLSRWFPLAALSCFLAALTLHSCWRIKNDEIPRPLKRS
jgi:predicted MFS family arabinose efflux permease